MKFLHAADIHLDSPLRGLDEYEGAPVQKLRGASRRAFTAMVELAVRERVDFVLLAGDIYDGDWLDVNTGLFFLNSVQELERAGIPIVLLNGNHDADSRITSRLTLTKNIHAMPTDVPGTIKFDNIRVAVHGQGFAGQAETRNLAKTYPAPVKGYYNIGILHTALDGREGHASYAPCSLDDLIARGYDYWALGHIHNRESVNGDQHPRIEFPGNLQGRHARETGAKGCLLVTVDASGRATPEFRTLDVIRWEVVSVDASAAETFSDVLESAQEAVVRARDGADGRPLAARVEIRCTESMSHELGAEREHFCADLRGQTIGNIWIEKIKIVPIPAERVEEASLGEDATSELRAVLDELRSKPDDIREILSSGDCDKLVNKIPPDLRATFEEATDEIVARVSALLQIGATEYRQ